MKTLVRPYFLYGFGLRFSDVRICKCEKSVGPEGGICARCGGAIPDESERKKLTDEHK